MMMEKGISILCSSVFALASVMAFAESDRNAHPLKPPVPSYPVQAAMAGMSGMCEAHFDVDQKGQIVGLRAQCSNLVFCDEVIRAMSVVEFAPKIIENKPMSRYGVVYPLEFTISGGETSDGYAALKSCEQQQEAVS